LITRIQELSSNSVAPHFGLPGKQILVSQGFAVGTSPGSVEEKFEILSFNSSGLFMRIIGIFNLMDASGLDSGGSSDGAS